MSRLGFSLDDNWLRSQLVDLNRSVDNSAQQLIDKILHLSSIKLLILFIVYALDKPNSKEVAEKVYVDRRTAGKYMRELVEDNLLGCTQAESYNPDFPAVKTYFVLHEKTKILLGLAIGAVQSTESGDYEKNGALHKESVYSDFDNSSETTSKNRLLILAQVNQFYPSLVNQPPTAKKIFHSLSDSPQSIKQVSQQVGCDKTTASKYLKHFFDLGIVNRETASSSSVGRGELLYFLNSDVFKVVSEFKNQHSYTSPVQLEPENSNHVTVQSTTISTSNVKTCESSEEVNMNIESFQQQSTSQSANLNAAKGFDPLANKIKEFIKLVDQVERIEQELRDLLGPGKETEIAIARLKSKNL